MKRCRNDTSGMSSLSDEKGNKVSAPDQLANILNTQFQSVFTIEIPAPQDLLPPISPFPRMPDILISEDHMTQPRYQMTGKNLCDPSLQEREKVRGWKL